MNRSLFPLIICCLLSTISISASAQGTAFTYQGRLMDGGNPANGSYDLRFTIYDSTNSPGTLIAGPLTNAPSAVSNGLFNVTLDFGAGVFNGNSRWLEIGVRSNGSASAYTTLTPRQQFTATPYAITAGNLSGILPASQLSGALSVAQLPAAVVTNGASGVNISGTFSGNGAGVTNVVIGTLNAPGILTWPGNFALSSSPGVGGAPVSVAAADINGDGKLDLISANFFANTLTVLTNNGSGGVLLASSPGVGSAPVSVTAADVNGDGKVDLISANIGDNTLTVMTNNGTGGFVLASSPVVGANPQSFTAADVNGDGKVDLISANTSADTLTVLTNNGSGGFVLASSPAVGDNPLDVTAADVNGDGKVDLISANYVANTLTVLTNKGSGIFVLASSPGVILPAGVTTADINGDGKVDLISASPNANSLTVLTNNGSGSFVLASSPGVGTNPESFTAADVNGDGKVDLISANETPQGTLTVLTNNGSGGFVLASSPGVGYYPVSVVAADLNGDGRADLISANSDSTLTVLLNTPTFTGKFSGDGSELTNLNASGLSGTVSDSHLSANIPRLNGTNVFTGPVTATSFSGDGSGLSGVAPASGSSNYVAKTGDTMMGTLILPANGLVAGGNQLMLSAGNVGIGTASPAGALDVRPPDAASGPGRSVIIKAQKGAANNVGGNLLLSSGDNGIDSANGYIGFGIGATVAGSDFSVNEKMRITSSGNVGIGTTIPGGQLSIAGLGLDGSVLQQFSLYATTNFGLLFQAPQDSFGNRLDYSFSWRGGGPAMTISGQTRNVGIGTISPQAPLDVNGMARVKVLSITGGADVAEPFAISDGEIPKGAVVVIDDAHPGQLKLSTQAYDKRVAGIVSGAGGVNPGLTLSQQCLVEGGQNVALTGRVYALADAANGPIEPGDLLTTSAVPGHAMKVTAPAKSQGAIIGKAMSHLQSGRGLVLVLVTLQ